MKWGGGRGVPFRDPQSVSLDLFYHKKYQYIWFKGDLNSF